MKVWDNLLIYGMTSGSLQFRLGLTREQAANIAERYWEAFPRVHPWLFEVIEECKRHGYVTYWSGRRWYEDNPELMYKAANALVQGGSHDLMMVAICRVADFLDKKYPDAKIFSTVHDEIDIEMPEEMVDEVIPQVQEIAEVPDLFDIPFFTDVKVGKNYGVMKGWEAGVKRSD